MLNSPLKLDWIPVFNIFTIRVAMIACLLRVANSEEPVAQKPDLSKIRTWTLAEVPLPRDRQNFGIGEQVYCWVERPPGNRIERPIIAGKELDDFIVWTATGSSTMLPTVTRLHERSILTVALSDRDTQFNIGAANLDPAKSIDDRSNDWRPVEPPAIAQRDIRENRAAADREGETTWPKRLGALFDLRDGRNTPFEKVEEAAREILSEPLSKKELAIVYFHLAELYAQAGMIHPDRVLEYSRRALALPLGPTQRTTLLIYRGDACLARRSEETFAERRWAATVEYLRGLIEIAQHNLPIDPPQRKAVARSDRVFIGRKDLEAAEDKLMQEIHEYNKRVDLEVDLIQHRNIVWQQLEALHAPKP